MDLKSLHSLMTRKNFCYFEGNTNNISDNLFIRFSSGYNGRGNTIDFRIGETNNDIHILLRNDSPQPDTEFILTDASDADVFRLIEQKC